MIKLSQLSFIPSGTAALRQYQASIATDPSKVKNHKEHEDVADRAYARAIRKRSHPSTREGFYETATRRILKAEALKKQGGKCLYCTEPLLLSVATAEHRIPISRGGLTEKNNIDAACEPCNKLKGSYTKAEFNQSIHNPDYARDPWDLYLTGMDIRMKRRTELACKRIRAMVGQK